jgi:hypothetical protein
MWLNISEGSAGHGCVLMKASSCFFSIKHWFGCQILVVHERVPVSQTSLKTRCLSPESPPTHLLGTIPSHPSPLCLPTSSLARLEASVSLSLRNWFVEDFTLSTSTYTRLTYAIPPMYYTVPSSPCDLQLSSRKQTTLLSPLRGTRPLKASKHSLPKVFRENFISSLSTS